MKTKQVVFSKEVICAASVALILTACTAKPEDKTSSAGTSTATSTALPPITVDGPKPASGATATATGATTSNTSSSTPTGSPTTATAPSGSPAPNGADPLSGKVNINLADLNNDLPICSVAGNEIKVGDYKRMLRLQQIQANQNIVLNPSVRQQLLAEAKKRNVELTGEEKAKLLEAAHQQKGQSPAEFKEFLKKTNATEQQFDQDILQTGLAFKTSNMMIENALLPEMVNRELLAQAAESSGKEKEAMNFYLTFKHSKQFSQLEQQTGLSQDQLRDEIVKEELAKMQIKTLEPKAVVTDAEVKKTYDEHKELFKHDERIKLSTILIACPEHDIGPIQSVRNQVIKANPKLEGKQLDDAVTQVMEAAKQKALILLGQAKGGSDFGKLANENSNEPLTVQKKNGGDMGFIDKRAMIPALADAVFKLKPGQVLDQIVKSELGYNVYKCTGKEAPGYLKYQDVKPQLEALAKQAKLQQVIASWLNDRRKVVKVEFTPKFLAIANGGKTDNKLQ
ncbi:MAG: peptidylprolyl isomerase [Candidatus Obscuribacterales bacterium]|nr:peptidylprolyl isomerase [Candidatus Obscuribacterales bacterium]